MQKWSEEKWKKRRNEDSLERFQILFMLLNTWHSASLLSSRLNVPLARSRKQNNHQFLPMRTNMLLFLWSCFWFVRDFNDQWQINVLQARRPWDQCAVDCATGSSYYCLYGGEKRPLGRPVFPVYWFYCSHPFVWVAEGWSDKPSARQEENSGAQS